MEVKGEQTSLNKKQTETGQSEMALNQSKHPNMYFVNRERGKSARVFDESSSRS